MRLFVLLVPALHRVAFRQRRFHRRVCAVFELCPARGVWCIWSQEKPRYDRCGQSRGAVGGAGARRWYGTRSAVVCSGV